MNKHIEKAMELRDNPDVHYNCAQSILCAYADELGLDQDTAFNLGFNFGSGMKNGDTCGVVTGGLMVLGLKGVNNVLLLNEFRKRIMDNHGGLINCVDLLRVNKENGGVKKLHCDGMIKEAIEIIDDIVSRETL